MPRLDNSPVSPGDAALVTHLFDSTSRRDFKAVMDCYADDIALQLHGINPAGIAEGALGKEAVGEWFGDWFRQFGPDYRFDLEEVRDLGAGQVLVIGKHVAHSRTAGIPLEGRAGWLYVLRDGKIVRCDAYGTADLALEAAGLS